MTPEQFKDARETMGLSARGMAKALDMPGDWADRTIRKWERGDHPVPGPVAKLVRFMVKHGVDGDK